VATEEIIVLASSLKLGGRCLAGISTGTGAWVRPVSGLGQGQLFPSHCAIDGAIPRLLDIVRFEHTGAVDDPAQPENVRVSASPWTRTGVLTRDEAYDRLRLNLAAGPVLLGSRDRSMHDDVARQGVEASLALIEPDDLVFVHERRFDKPSPRARFRLANCSYDLPLTDLVVRPRLLARPLGRHRPAALDLGAMERVLLTVSLGEPINAEHPYRYKLVAAVLPLPT
jgi:putative nucleic acid modification protein with dual OB domain